MTVTALVRWRLELERLTPSWPFPDPTPPRWIFNWRREL